MACHWRTVALPLRCFLNAYIVHVQATFVLSAWADCHVPEVAQELEACIQRHRVELQAVGLRVAPRISLGSGGPGGSTASAWPNACACGARGTCQRGQPILALGAFGASLESGADFGANLQGRP